jgi:hypothetical protein
MRKTYFLFWQAFSLPIAYSVSNAYLNTNNYITQFNNLFSTNFPTNIPENPTIALALFLIILIIPNLYVFLSLYSLKYDLINGRLQRDIHITPHKQHIEINGKNYMLKNTLDRQITSFTLLSSLPSFLINYHSLSLLLLYFTTLTMISIVYTEGSTILINPYLRLKYQVFTLQSEGKNLYIIMEKEKEFERPRFSDYIIDWYYDHLILIGFKDMMTEQTVKKTDKGNNQLITKLGLRGHKTTPQGDGDG